MLSSKNCLLSWSAVTILLLIGLDFCPQLFATALVPKDNGDVYIVEDSKSLHDRQEELGSTPCGFDDENDSDLSESNEQKLDLNEVLEQCNASYIIPLDYLTTFNTSGVLPDEIDKTGMCFIRCFYEMSGFLQDWKLNTELIQEYMWPATGDTIPFCEKAEANETNPCVRAYAIAKCLMIRAIVDAHYV